MRQKAIPEFVTDLIPDGTHGKAISEAGVSIKSSAAKLAVAGTDYMYSVPTHRFGGMSLRPLTPAARTAAVHSQREAGRLA